MKYLILLLVALSSQLMAEDKVFRCNLDDRTRILVFQSNKYYAAYDTHAGSFWKFWQANNADSGIKFEGAVYDGRHGPQPSTQGSIISEKKEKQIWQLGNNKAIYTSYSPVRKNFTCSIVRADESVIKIVETPQISNGKLSRMVKVSGLKSGETIQLGSFKISKNGQQEVK